MQKYVIPKKDLLVRDPVSFNPLPIDGAYIDWNGNAGRYWRRRVKCSDVSIADKEVKQEKIIIDEPLQLKRKRSSK